jgi:hypothetical protein
MGCCGESEGVLVVSRYRIVSGKGVHRATAREVVFLQYPSIELGWLVAAVTR